MGEEFTENGRAAEADRAAVVESWERDVPVPGPGPADRLILVLDSLRGLAAVRRQVRAFLAAGLQTGSPEDQEDAVDAAVLVIDELTSNALRHGVPPSRLLVGDEPDRWLVVVSDSAPQRALEPAVDRPAEAGGHGLYVVADLSSGHGVHYLAREKLVWATLAKPSPGADG